MQFEIETLYQKHGRYEVICDWLKLMTISIKNALSVKHLGGYEKREQEYLNTMKRYSQDEQQCFVKSFKQLVDIIDKDVKNGVFKDWLGDFYMHAGIRDEDKQQEFTPYHLGALMAELDVAEKWDEKKNKDILTINDPCVGGGCLPIAMCEALKKRGFDYQRNALFVCNDNDEKCVKNYDIYIVILKHLNINFNKDCSYPKHPFNNLVMTYSVLLEHETKLMGYKHWLIKINDGFYKVWYFKDDGDIHIKYVWCEKDGTSHGGTDGEIYIPLFCLNSAGIFYDYIEKRITYFEKQKAEDKQRIIDYKKVFEQLVKINAYSLDALEVKELL